MIRTERDGDSSRLKDKCSLISADRGTKMRVKMVNVYCLIRSLFPCHLEEHPTSISHQVPRGSTQFTGLFLPQRPLLDWGWASLVLGGSLCADNIKTGCDLQQCSQASNWSLIPIAGNWESHKRETQRVYRQLEKLLFIYLLIDFALKSTTDL